MSLEKRVLSNNIPNHIAIILDGNGRWAKKKLLPRLVGHNKGLESVRKIIEYCIKYNVKILTIYAFSTENWKRPTKEVDGLLPFYKMSNWDAIRCHEEESVSHPDIFDYAYDYHKIGKAPDREITRTPHPGLHRQIHYAEFYYNKMLENGFTAETF